MKAKEIKQHANFLYEKSSHFISGVFMVTGIILAILGGFSYYPLFMVAVILFEPLQLGVIRSLLNAYDRQANKVSTANYSLMGLKEYPSAFPVFVGKRIVIILVQLLIVLATMFIISGNIDSVIVAMRGIITGGFEFLYSLDENNVIQWLIPGEMVLGVMVALLVGLYLDIIFALSYFYAIDKDYSLFESLFASAKAMRGNTMRYIGVLFQYIIPFIGATIAILLSKLALENGFTSLANMMPYMSTPIIVFMVIIVATCSTAFTVMFYKVKMQLAVTVLYKDIEGNKISD